MRSCLHGLRAGGPGRDKSKQGQDLEGSVSQIVGHRPGRHFPIITGPSNRHNHYQRQIKIVKIADTNRFVQYTADRGRFHVAGNTAGVRIAGRH